jgi:UDP-glucuronate 4-epimerase
MRVLVTGVEGFIGYHTAKALMPRGRDVIGLDDLNAYQDVRLKEARLGQVEDNPDPGNIASTRRRRLNDRRPRRRA